MKKEDREVLQCSECSFWFYEEYLGFEEDNYQLCLECAALNAELVDQEEKDLKRRLHEYQMSVI